MSAHDAVAFEVVSGIDPLPTLTAAWNRGERVLLIARDLPDALRTDLFTRAAVQRELSATHAHICSDFAPEASVIIATSGSSGSPRLIELSVDALITSARLGTRVIAFGEGDIWHASLSSASIGGLMIHVRALVAGATVRHASSPRVWSDLAGITHVSLVPTQLARLLDDPTQPPATLKAVMLGGGPSSNSLRKRAISRGIPLFATYGMTETASQVATGAVTANDEATFAGSPLAGITITIDPLHSEVLINTPTLARGMIVDGALIPFTQPFRTRDIGAFDANGRLHIRGRLDAMFISGGRNIHPETIERALTDLVGGRAACVVGVGHEKWGMRPVAFVDIELMGISAAFLRAQLRERLEPYLIPDTFFVLPQDEASRLKPSRAMLAQRLARGEHFEELA